MLEPAIDRLCWAVARAGPVEVGEDVRGALFQRPPEPSDLDESSGNTGGDGVDDGSHHLFRLVLVGFLVSGDDALVDTPGRFDMIVTLEQRLKTCALFVSEEIVAGVQRPADV